MSTIAMAEPTVAADQTRRQLDELECLLQRMLELPVVQVDPETRISRTLVEPDWELAREEMSYQSSSASLLARRISIPPPPGPTSSPTDNETPKQDSLASAGDTGESPAHLSQVSMLDEVDKATTMSSEHGSGEKRIDGDIPGIPPPESAQQESLSRDPEPELLSKFQAADDQPNDFGSDSAAPSGSLREASRLLLGVVGIGLWLVALTWALAEWMGWTDPTGSLRW
jgi:hypothetical protein